MLRRCVFPYLNDVDLIETRKVAWLLDVKNGDDVLVVEVS